MRPLLLIFVLLCGALAQDAPLPALTSARELRALPPAEAERAYPVRLRAVVTLVEYGNTVFFRDATGASFLRWRDGLPELHAGQAVEISGETYPGLYLTGVAAGKVTALGDTELPAPIPLTYEQLTSGQFHYERVEVRGIVRSVAAASGHLVLKLALGDGALDLSILEGDAATAEKLIDAEVRATGIAAGLINERRQLVAPQLRIQKLADLAVIEPAPAEPFAIPATPAAELLRFAPAGRAGHRVKVRGIVMRQHPGGTAWLRDNQQGVCVHSAFTESFGAGEVVEALGFPTMGKLNAELEDAIIRRTGETAGMQAVSASAEDLLTGRHDADLVQVVAKVRDAVREGDRLTLALQMGGVVFPALVQPCPADYAMPARGALLRLDGICRVVETSQAGRGFSARIRAFELLLKWPETDIVVLSEPPWWNTRRLTITASSLLAVAVFTFAWAAALRTRVAAQTAIIGEKLKKEAAAGERERIAREFHDTLEQELVGLALRLDAATTKVTEPQPRELLEAARRLVQNIQAEAHGLVRNLRARVLDDALLPDAITRAVAMLARERTIEVQTYGKPRRLPGLIEHELLRIAQEATTNAVKHGAATRIDIAVAFRAGEVQVRVADNGLGFDPANDAVKPGHFGLIGIRERVQKLGGRFALHSQPGAGATLEASVPISPASS